MKNTVIFLILFLLAGIKVFAQVGISTDNSIPDNSAMLDVKSTTAGVLLPRLTLDQRNAIASPAEGLMVFCTDCGSNGTLSIYSNSSWRTFSPCTSPLPVPTENTITPGQVIWKWNAVSGATGYKWGTTMSYSAATDMGSATSKTETGIVCGSTYSRYLWTYNTCGVSDMTILSQAISVGAPATPTAATHVSTQTSIVWKWHPAAGAIGYKWSANNDFSTATEMGTDTTKSETGISCGTPYTRYVWAYNGCDYSTSVVLSQPTLNCFTCGITTLSISHVAGDVAPVTKTTSYGTVTNIPGEPTKCWITSNLGSDHQATAVSDATEASAGWYWQFNRKRGYKHDGTNRTPNTTWITSIDENFDWQASNDPCTIELGGNWRIPTATEWTNVDASGGWNDWNGPWNSGLKVHAAGYFQGADGSLNNRGVHGDYWSSTQSDNTHAWFLLFNSGASNMVGTNTKVYGFSVRCVRNYVAP